MDFGRGSLILAVAAAACGGDAAGPDAAPPADARPIGCIDAPPAWLGRCEVAETGDFCTGVPDEARVFVELAPGDEVPMVIGPQGARMFVFAVRTQGIYPGDPDDPASPDNPEVDLRVGRAGAPDVARYRGRPVFSPADGDMLDAAGLFVVLEGTGEALVGVELAAGAEITDRDGEFRCGATTFTAAGP